MKKTKTKNYNLFKDKNGKSQPRKPEGPARGEYGHDDKSGRTYLEDAAEQYQQEPFYQIQQDVKYGDYKLGKQNIQIDHTGIQIDAKAGGVEFFKTAVNKNLIEVQNDENYPVIGGIVYALKDLGLPAHTMKLKEYAFEYPSISGGFDFGLKTQNVHANAQLIAIKFLIDTPYGEMTVKLKYDFGVGKSFKNVVSKDGKVSGKNVDETHGFYFLEFSMPKQTRDNLLNAAAQHGDEKLGESFKSARTFLESIYGTQFSEPLNKEAETVFEEKIIDKTVELLTNIDDPKAKMLQDAYKNNPGTKREAFGQFQKDLTAYIKLMQEQQRVEQWLDTGRAAGYFLGQLSAISGNKQLSHWANGITALTQGVGAAQKMGSALSAVANGASTLLSQGPTILNGAGAIVGIASFFMSLDSDDEDGSSMLFDMYMDLKQTILDMWQDQRESFVKTWELLDHMEKNNNDRFKITMEFLQHIYLDLRGLAIEQTQKIDDLREFLKDRLDKIESQSLRETIEEIANTPSSEYPVKCAGFASKLITWLKSTAFNDGVANAYHKKNDQLTELSDFITSRNDETSGHIKFSVPLAIAQSAGLHAEITKLPNPIEYFYVLHVYCELVSISSAVIRQDASVKENYRANMAELKVTLNNLEIFLEKTSSSTELWEKLINQYQQHFSTIQNMIIEGTLPEPQELYDPLPRGIRWSLLEDASTNIQRFESLPDIKKIKQKLSKALTLDWVGVQGEMEHTIHIPDFKVMTPAGRTTLTQNQFNTLHDLNPAIATRFEDLRDWFSRELSLQLGQAYSHISPGFKFKSGAFGGYGNYWKILFIYPFLRINNEYMIFARAGLDKRMMENDAQNFGTFLEYNRAIYEIPISCYHSAYPNGLSGATGSDLALQIIKLRERLKLSYIMNDLTLTGIKQKVLDIFNNQLMQKRQVILNCASNAVTLASDKAEMKKDYLSLIAMIKLFIPGFAANPNPQVIDNYALKLDAAAKDGSLESLKSLYQLLSGSTLTVGATTKHAQVWQQDIWLPLAPNENELTAQILSRYAVEHLKQSKISDHIKAAKDTITQTQKELERTNNDHLTPEELAQLQISKLSHSANKQQKILWDKLIKLQQLLTKEALIANDETQVKKINELLKSFDHLSQDFEKISPKFDRANNQADDETPQDIPEAYKNNDKFSTLQNLCANPDVDIEVLKQEMAKLEKVHASHLYQALNSLVKKPGEKPLQLAIRAQRADVVELLLQHDALIKPASLLALSQCQDEDVQLEISYLLDFYDEMQKLSDEDMKVGRTLGLINESINVINSAGELDIINIVIGETRDGKSSIVNCCAGVEYKLVKLSKYTSFLEVIGEMQEVTPTSDSTKSETSYPHLVKAGEHRFADMAGFGDSRGIAWDIANGVSTQLLGHRAKSLGGLILVFDASNLMTGGIDEVIAPLDAVAKMVNGDEALMSHIIIVVNRADELTSKEASERFAKFLNDNPDKDESIKILLQYLSTHPEKIIPTLYPDKHLRNDLLGRIDTLSKTPASIDKFNFSHFSKQTERFKKVINGLLTYRDKTCKDKDQITQAIINRLITQTTQLSNDLNHKKFLDSEEVKQQNFPQLSANILKEAKTVLSGQQQLRINLIELSHELDRHLSSYHTYKHEGDNHQNEDQLDAFMSMTRKAEIASEFLQSAAPIIRLMGINKIEEYQGCEAKEVSAKQTSNNCEDEGYSSCDQNTYEQAPKYKKKECSPDSFPFPGACGQIISESSERLPNEASPSSSGNEFTRSYGAIFQDYFQSGNAQLTLLQWVINTWINPYLPSNQLRALTADEFAMLKNLEKSLPQLRHRYRELSKHGVDNETMQWIYNNVNQLKIVLSDLLKNKPEVTASSLEAIRNKFARVDEQLAKLEKLLLSGNVYNNRTQSTEQLCPAASDTKTGWLTHWNLLGQTQPKQLLSVQQQQQGLSLSNK